MYFTIDIGGTKTLIAVFDENGTLVSEKKFPTNQKYELFIEELKQTLDGMGVASAKAIGIAAPGRFDLETGANAGGPNLAWEHAAPKKDLEKQYSMPVAIDNDANAAGLAEAHALDGQFSSVLYVTVSTGIGTGLVIDGQVPKGLETTEGGLQLFEWHGKTVYWQEFGSGKAINRDYGKMASEIEDPATWQEIVDQRLGLGFMNLIMVFDPDVIVIGGGVGAHLEKFHDMLVSKLEQLNLSSTRTLPPIQSAQHPEHAVAYGCYLMAKRLA